MLISMTGYGEAIKDGVRCELRSLNHRFFRASINLPPYLSRYECRIESLLKEKLTRGMVYCSIITTKVPQIIICDQEIARKYRDALLSLKDSLNLDGEVTIDHLYGFSGVLKMEVDDSEVKRIWDETSNAIEKAMDNLIRMREKEGRKIEKVTKNRLKKINKMLSDIRSRIPQRMERERKKIEKIQFKEECNGLYLLERINVEEEINRLQFHLSSMKEIVGEETSQGKRLLFLLQEILRETNTVASKIQDAQISHITVDVKTEIESLREELENVL